MLRRRITLIVVAGLVLVFGALLVLHLSYARFDQRRMADIAIAGQTSLWKSLLKIRTDRLSEVASDLAGRLSIDAPELDPQAIAEVVAGANYVRAGNIDVEVLLDDGEVAYANKPLFRTRTLFGTGSLMALRDDDVPVISGLRQQRPDRFVVGLLRPIFSQGIMIGALSVAVDANEIVDEFAFALEEPALLVSRRGRFVTTTDPKLFETAGSRLPTVDEAYTFITIADRLYFAVATPVDEAVHGRAGALLTMRDVTDALRPTEQVQRIGFTIIGFICLLLVAAVYLTLRQTFRPLEGALEGLEALSRGELDRPVSVGGAGEIRQIADAVAVFRNDARRLHDQDAQIARQRRRQERIIVRQLRTLASTLDDEGREAIEEDLRFALVSTLGAETDANAELAVLATVLERMSKRITAQHLRLTELIRELQDAIVTRARLAGLEQELEIARTLQRSLLPNPLPPSEGVNVSGLMETAKEVGGDFYDFFDIDDERLAIIVADVSGKGVPASLFMTITRTLIKSTALAVRDIGRTVDAVNAFLASDNEQMMFVTLFIGVYNKATLEFTYVNAGHNPPLRVRPDGSAVFLATNGDPIMGVIEDASYTANTILLHAPEQIFLYTDGVTEAFNSEGEAFGEERLTKAVEKAAKMGLPLPSAVRDAVLEFESGAERADDLTCAVLTLER